jgi:hypothetical protein
MESTPENVISELRRIQSELDKAPEALFESETKLARLEHDLDTAEAIAFLSATGTVGERNAQATLAGADIKLSRDIARAEVNRVKTKIKVLESACMSTAVIAKQVELMWRTS